MLNLLRAIFAPLWALLWTLRWLIVALLAIGLPIFLYLTLAKEPIFSVENDVELGKQTVLSIQESPDEYPLLSEEDYPEAYERLRALVGRLVSSSEIQYADVFDYDSVKIIHDDSVLNAFCAPGGFIYVFSGLIHYLEAEDHLAGVLGHEIAHAELRHSSTRLQKQFGAEALFNFLLLSSPVGAGDVVNAQIAKELLTLDYSRDQEAQADDYSVRYLATSGYSCDGTAGFFAKILEQGDDVGIPEFLSDHPASDARVRDIRAAAAELGCSTQLATDVDWQAFQASLPVPVVEQGEAVAADEPSA